MKKLIVFRCLVFKYSGANCIEHDAYIWRGKTGRMIKVYQLKNK